MLRSSLRSSKKLQALATQSPAEIPTGVVNQAFSTEEGKAAGDAPSKVIGNFFFTIAQAIKSSLIKFFFRNSSLDLF